MSPAEIRLYNWTDVGETLRRVATNGSWPPDLIWASSYWDGLSLGVRPGQEPVVRKWLQELFESRYEPADEDPDREAESLLLECRAKVPRRLPILWEPVEESPPAPRAAPTWERPSLIVPTGSTAHPGILPPALPPVVAFHAFKGGVGRTILALAFGRHLARSGRTVLLVDGDLEEPGITWLARDRFPQPPISLADFLTLLHGDPDLQGLEPIALAAERLQNSFDSGIFVLPAFRSVEQFEALQIRPEHLVRGSRDPYRLTSTLARLGQAVGADVVLVDLRAGLSELSAGLLLDPRVYRVLVTTCSGQALEGTAHLLTLLGQRAPSRLETDPAPRVVLSQIGSDRSHRELADHAQRRLLEAGVVLAGPPDSLSPNPQWDPSGTDGTLEILQTPFDPGLTLFPGEWDAVIPLLDQAAAWEALDSLLDWLPGTAGREPVSAQSDPSEGRQRLRTVAEQLIYAESGAGQQCLSTTALRKLASDHRTELPAVVVVGAKGAGKTFTFLQLTRVEQWSRFLREIGMTKPPVDSVDLDIFPLLEPKNLAARVAELTKNRRMKVSEDLGLGPPPDVDEVRQGILDGLKQDRNDGEWRGTWLEIIARGVGVDPHQPNPWRFLTERLHGAGRRLIVLMDGLEDLLQELPTSTAQQTALRALLQDVSRFLSRESAQRVGLLVFVRRDLTTLAIRQNSGQFLQLHEPYSLKWNREEALRLVHWMAALAEAIPDRPESAEKLRASDLAERLIPLWGRKLGKDNSREGRSAEWVISALSDFQGQIQARDLVRLLFRAAHLSVEDKQWADRILAPQSIRDALAFCSEQKIEELQQENPSLGELLDVLKNRPVEQREIPFSREEMGLSAGQVEQLERGGVLFREDDECFIPEIFRRGLRFTLKSGARPRVLTLARRAARGR